MNAGSYEPDDNSSDREAHDLARYFDRRVDNLGGEAYELLRSPIQLWVIQQIADSARQTLVRNFFTLLALLLSQPDQENLQKLHDYIRMVAEQHKIDPHQEQLLEIYEQFRSLLQARTLSELAHCPCLISCSHERSVVHIAQITRILRTLKSTVDTLVKEAEQGSRSYGYAAALNAAVITLDDMHSTIQAEIEQSYGENIVNYKQTLPENELLVLLLQRCQAMIKAELRSIEGQARIVLELKTRFVQKDGQGEVFLHITNSGNSEVHNVRVILELDSDTFEIVGSNERFPGDITMQLSHSVSFVIKQKPHYVVQRLSFIIIYDDIGWRDRKIFFALNVKPQSAFTEIPNPYDSGRPVSEKSMFFGRAKDLKFLQEKLLASTNGEILLLYSQHRSGKTSLLYRLRDEIKELEAYIPIFLDVKQAIGLDLSPGNMLDNFSADILAVAKDAGYMPSQEGKPSPLQDPLATFTSLLGHIINSLQGQKLVLLIDEFDFLTRYIEEDSRWLQFAINFVTRLRQVDGVSFLLTGGPMMHHTMSTLWSAFAREDIVAHRLSQLTAGEARQLIEQPIRGALVYDPRVLSTIQRLTDDQPCLLQLFCETVVRLCNKWQVDYVDSTLVTIALDSILDSSEHFDWIWKHLLRPEERRVLYALAQEQHTEQQGVASADIIEFYNANRWPPEPKLERLLDGLVEKNFITPSASSARRNRRYFRVAAGLMWKWLLKNQALW